MSYATSSVPLTFTVYDYSSISWMGYSLDSQSNVTITGNTTLTGISLGQHSVIVYANDTYGNMGSSDRVYFTRTYGCVTIKVQYKDGYPRSNAFVLWKNTTQWNMFGTTNEEGVAIRDNYLVPGPYWVSAWYPDLGTQFGENAVLVVNATGHGSATITADYGRPCVTIKVQYLDGHPRSGAIVKETYTGWIGVTNESGYVSDSGFQPNTVYEFKAYWPDLGHQFGPTETIVTNGNGDGSTTIQADYEITPPAIEILSPENMIYMNTSLPLNFTVYDFSSISWIGYSLDDQANVTITGNTTLTSLTTGQHNIIVYANDTYGNMGSSNKIYFKVDTTPPLITIFSPQNKTYYSNVIPLTFEVDEPTSWIGYSLDNQPNITISGNTTINVENGLHQIIIYANDALGNMGYSQIVYFTILPFTMEGPYYTQFGTEYWIVVFPQRRPIRIISLY